MMARIKPILVLASSSPRRLKLLSQVGIKPDKVYKPGIDETPQGNESPNQLVIRLAKEKALIGAKCHPNAYVLSADTVVSLGSRILGKADTEIIALHYLNLLSGRKHSVYGGICVIDPNGNYSSKIVKTVVAFKKLNIAEIRDYLMFREWEDKSGGYAIQGRAAAFVRNINGSYHNVVGLSLYHALNALRGLGYHSSGSKLQ